MAEVRITGVCLEHVADKSKKDDKVFHSLVVYEQGQKYRRTVTEIKLSGQEVDKLIAIAEKSVGKVATLVCDMSQFDGKVTYYLKGVTA